MPTTPPRPPDYLPVPSPVQRADGAAGAHHQRRRDALRDGGGPADLGRVAAVPGDGVPDEPAGSPGGLFPLLPAARPSPHADGGGGQAVGRDPSRLRHTGAVGGGLPTTSGGAAEGAAPGTWKPARSAPPGPAAVRPRAQDRVPAQG